MQEQLDEEILGAANLQKALDNSSTEVRALQAEVGLLQQSCKQLQGGIQAITLGCRQSRFVSG